MKIGILFLFVGMRLLVRALPVNEKEILSNSCIEMTPEREQEIHKIVEEVTSFIETLTNKHEDTDFTLVKLKIEKHSDNEQDEKETVLKLVINDCKNAGTKTREAEHIENRLDADNSKVIEETSSEEKSLYKNSGLDAENDISDLESNSESLENSVSNIETKEQISKINENANSVKNNKQIQALSKKISEEESAICKCEPRAKTTQQSLQGNKIKNLIKDLEEINDKEHLSDNGKGVFIFAPTIDNSRVELKNNFDELYKDLYDSAIQKLNNLETEIEKLKKTQKDSGLVNFKDYFNKLNKNINPYYAFGRNIVDEYANGNRGLELIYF